MTDKNSNLLPRTMTRGGWRWWYREIRIVRRECAKALSDMMEHGSGFVRMSASGMTHVARSEIYKDDRL